MSFLIDCPNCGPREFAEFRYAGQILPDGSVTVGNLPKVLRERWYHRYGCRQWLAIRRNIHNNEIQSICLVHEEAV